MVMEGAAGTIKRVTLEAANLLQRLDEHRDEVLRFLHDFAVPFHKQRDRGGPPDGGRPAFLAVRSYLTTARNQGQGMLEVLTTVFEGRPWMPPTVGP